MLTSQKKILQEVSDGKISFSAGSNAVQKLKPFQEVVQVIKRLDEKGLFTEVVYAPPYKGRGIYGMIPSIVVRGGLSYRGIMYLKYYPLSRVLFAVERSQFLIAMLVAAFATIFGYFLGLL